MSRPRWSNTGTPGGKWIVRQSDLVTPRYHSTWTAAVMSVRAQIGRWAIADVFRRAKEAPGEYEGVLACLIDAPGLQRKRRRIYETAAYHRLPITTAIEEESDPRDTTIYVKVKGRRP